MNNLKMLPNNPELIVFFAHESYNNAHTIFAFLDCAAT